MNKMLEDIFNLAKADIQRQYDRLNGTLNEHAGTPIGDFCNRVLSWRVDKARSQWLWELFHEAIDMSNIGFMDSFDAFVVNALLDDAAFRIEWRKNVVDELGNLEWLPGGNIKTILVDKSDPGAQPVVLYDNDGTQNVSLLMEAMDHKEWENEQRILSERKLEELFRQTREG